MRYKLLFFTVVFAFIFSACSKKEEPKQEQSANPNVHKVVVEEAIQVSSYTYLKVKEGNKDYWMAVTTIDAKQGDIFYYTASMEMKDFESKELKRTFDSIQFVQDISKIPPVVEGSGIKAEPQRPVIEKENVSVQPAVNGVTISQIFSNPDAYKDKIIKVKGKVSKINSGIMKKNWVHIQDGTSSGKDFDLTVTTNDVVQTGDIITCEGRIVLNKDFGFGYSYKVIMEEAKVSK
jgi:hypothetical protein